jgi:RES domain-containing protein
MPEVVGWRIVGERHARTAFSGEGARIFEGRWNSAGVRMVYCSESLALAALEILVHTQPIIPRQNYRAFRVSWSDKLMARIELKMLPSGWDAQPARPVSRAIGDEWIKSARSVVLTVPSVIVPLERTFLLNPQHRDFSRLKIVDLGQFALDRRLR